MLFCSDGNFDVFVDDIVAAGFHGLVFEPLTRLEPVVEKYGQTHVIVGNTDTRILLYGSKEDIRAEVERCMSLSAVPTCAGRRCVSGLTGTADKRAMNSTAVYGD